VVTNFVEDNQTDFPFFFVFSQLSSEILLYIILIVVIYSRHRSNWHAIESLPLVRIIPEQNILVPLRAEFNARGIDENLLDDS
jgi:hypothetical protein